MAADLQRSWAWNRRGGSVRDPGNRGSKGYGPGSQDGGSCVGVGVGTEGVGASEPPGGPPRRVWR